MPYPIASLSISVTLQKELMNTFEDSPTHELVTELLARIEHSNGLELTPLANILRLRCALDVFLAEFTSKVEDLLDALDIAE